MNSRNIATALVLAATAFAGTAFADDITIDNNAFVSSKSRAEVQAELAQYIASRDQVNALNGEDSGSTYLAQHRVRNTGTTLAAR